MENPIGKIERTPLREVWRHEARHFTAWLADNLDVLGEVIGLDLSLVDREASAGDFRVDLLAETPNGDIVIIENQLERSDHDHLGKVLTYLAAFGSNTGVWIVGEPRAEHTKAVAWLNDSMSNVNMHLLRAEAVRIGDSAPALLLTPIVGPSEEGKEVAREKQGQAERHVLRKQFWSELLGRAAPKTKLHSNRSPREQNWLDQSAGRTGFSYNYVIRQDDWRVELYIDVGDADMNNKYLEFFRQHADRIQGAFGGDLEWQSLDTKRACRISTSWREGGYRRARSDWPKIQDEMIDAMIRLEAALRDHINSMPNFRTDHDINQEIGPREL